jgi:hypothetical protein
MMPIGAALGIADLEDLATTNRRFLWAASITSFTYKGAFKF